MSSSHFVARITIERVDHVDTKKPGSIMTSVVVEDTKRFVTQLASFTVRGDQLTELLTKVPKHLELVDDIEAVDSEKKGNTR